MKEQITVSFPGLGIEDFVLNKVAFSIGPVTVRWYGIFVTLGMVIAVLYTFYRAKKKNISTDDLLDLSLFTIFFGVIGARLYYVITYGGYTFWELFQVWEGGLAIYGGIIGGILAIYGVCRFKKLNFFGMIDCVGPGVMIAQAIGRWGNFFNGEAYGAIVPEGSILYVMRMGLYPHPHDYRDISGMIYVHPTFLYECLWNVLGFILINLFYKKKKFDGEIACWYLAWYGFGRMFIEGLRTDSLMVGPFRVSQLIGLLCFVGCGTLTVWGRIHAYKKEKVAASVVEASANAEENEETENGEDH